MNLNGERLVGAQYLEQKRQLTKTIRHFIAEQCGFVGVDDVTQAANLTAGIFNF